MTILKSKIVSKVIIHERLERFLREEGVWTEFKKRFDHEFFDMYNGSNDAVCTSLMYAFKWSESNVLNEGNPRYDKWSLLYDKYGEK